MTDPHALAVAPVATDLTPYLLDDVAVARFVVTGYHTLRPELPADLHAGISTALDALPHNPGDGILDAVPALYQVWNAPEVRGFLTSVLGADYRMNPHRHWHCQRPGGGGAWHQDSRNQRHHEVRVLLGLYYPHDVSTDMGPTTILPGSHFRNCPTDRMGSNMTFREQVALAVPGGTIAFTHYDIWHTATRNISDRPRHMLKFLFSRGSAPTGPSWASTEAGLQKASAVLNGVRAIACSQSDHYKELALRREMWAHLLGKSPTPIPTPT